MNLPLPSPDPSGLKSIIAELHQVSEKLRGLTNLAELQLVSEKLQGLAGELQKRDEALQGKLTNYPYLERTALRWAREQFEREAPSVLPDKDLETIAREEGAMSFEEFMKELGFPDEASNP